MVANGGASCLNWSPSLSGVMTYLTQRLRFVSAEGASWSSRGREAVVRERLRETRPEGPTFHRAMIIKIPHLRRWLAFGRTSAHGLTAAATS
jgi:hypothetical protein